MPNRAVLGTQWGDEGKGKVVDILSEKSDIVARCQGGANAGHTVLIGEKKFILHLIPSGILHRKSSCLIGNGVVLDLDQLFAEITELENEGVNVIDRLWISGLAHLVLPYHKWTEKQNEERLGKSRIGTTLRGIGPSYADKYSRFGIRVFDLLQPAILKEKIVVNYSIKSDTIGSYADGDEADPDRLYDKLIEYGNRLRERIVDASRFIQEAVDTGKSILFEGAQGSLLDIDFGTYPFVTSSNTTIGGILTGLGIPCGNIDEVIGVAKAYTTRVGSGPFPTELTCDAGRELQDRGKEFGATTGRPRRCGWLDLNLLRRSVAMNGIQYLAITKLDVLDDLSEISVCTGYKLKNDGVSPETEFYDLSAVEPIYETLPGWKSSTSGIRVFNDLPASAKEYISFIETFTGVRASLISTGPERDETILMPPGSNTRKNVSV